MAAPLLRAMKAANRAHARGDTLTAGLIYDLLNGTATEADAAAMRLPSDELEAVLITHRFNQALERSL